jgi:hypothetical protein
VAAQVTQQHPGLSLTDLDPGQPLELRAW